MTANTDPFEVLYHANRDPDATADCPHAWMVEVCDGWTDADDPMFVCCECKRQCGYCDGADDEHPDLCDECWFAKVTLPTQSEIEANLAPLSREECGRRGLR